MCRCEREANSESAAIDRPTAFAVVLPEMFRQLSCPHRSIDANGRRGVAIPVAVFTDNHPAMVCSLDDLGMVDNSHRSKTSLPRPLTT
jgi:hypothetical protein